MKKTLLVLSTLLISALSLAGTKEDYESAVSKYNNNHNLNEFTDSLSKIASAKSDTYTRMANINLATIKIQEKKYGDAKIYLNKVLNDKSSSKEEKVQTYIGFYQIADETNNAKDKLTYIKELVKLAPDNQLFKTKEIIDNLENKNVTTAKNLYNTFYKTLKNDSEKAGLNSILVEEYIKLNNFDEAKKLASESIKLKDSESKATGYVDLYKISIVKDNKDEALKNLLEANKLTDNKNAELLQGVASLYDELNKPLKAYEYYIKVMEILKSKETYLPVILHAEILNKTSDVDKYTKELKTKLNEEEKNNLNAVLATYLRSIGAADNALKYANKVLNEDKNNNGYLLLSLLSYDKGNKTEALNYIEKAISLNVEGAKELKEQILNSK